MEQSPSSKVIAFMTDNHIDPALAAEAYALEPLPSAARD